MTAVRTLMEAARAIRRYKLRTAFMMLGSLIGVAASTLVISVGQGAQGDLLRTVRQVVGDAGVLLVGGGSRLMGGSHSGASRLTIDDVAAVAEEVNGVGEWDPQAELPATVRYDDATTTVRVLGGSERWNRVWGRSATSGETFDAAAIGSAARVALVGATVVRKLFAGQNPVGAEIRIGAVTFRVIGVLEVFGVDMHGMDRDNEIVVPITTLMRRLSNRDAVSLARLLVRDPSRQEAVAADIRRALRTRHALGRDQPDDFRVITASQVQANVATIERIIWWYVPLVGGVVLIVGGVVSATLMFSSVNERTAEIGLRGALGAQPSDIRRQFLLETAATVVAGGIGGVLLGVVGVAVVSTHTPVHAVVSWMAVVIGICASAVVGFAAGVAPAQRAASLRPVDALR